jgi:hypothetical protein
MSRLNLIALISLWFACRGEAAPPVALPTVIALAAVPPLTHDALPKQEAGGAATAEAVPNLTDDAAVDRALAFVLDRAAQARLKPGDVKLVFGRFVPSMKDAGKNEMGWDFSGTTDQGAIRRVDVSFTPASNDKGEYIDPPVWQLKRTSFHIHDPDPKAAFARLSKRISGVLKAPKWKADSTWGWKLKGYWEVSLSRELHPPAGVNLTVTEPEGP